jgi:hypothetical protein
MSTVIRLDRNAIDALFPDGSEARVELQRAVLSTVIKQSMHVKSPAQIEAMIEKELTVIHADTRKLVAESSASVAKEWFQSSWGNHFLTSDRKQCIRKAVEDSMAEHVSESIKSAVSASRESVVFRASKIAERDIQRIVDETVDKSIEEAVKKRFIELAAKA